MTRGVNDRLLLALAAVAVAFAAADTYVVVLALPDMMATVGLAVDELQRAAPIVSGFLLGYVAMLPLVGRIADLRGRLPVLVGSLVVFALGSLVTAAAFDLPSMVVGRFLQGVGGGGLVPATLALVADLYPPSRRGVPLGVVGAVQELGSVVGPLYGAVVLAVAEWQAIFAINLAVGLVLAVAIRSLADPSPIQQEDRRVGAEMTGRPDWIGGLLLLLTLVALVLTMLQPPFLTSQVTLGLGFVPLVGASRWLAPVGHRHGASWGSRSSAGASPRDGRWSTYAAGRTWPRRADLLGAALLAAGAGRHHPRLRHGRPRGRGLLPGRALAADRLAARGRGVLGARAAHRGAARPARSVRRDAGLGLPAGELLRRRGPDRGPGGHPDLRAGHGLPHLPARRRARPRPAARRAAGRRARGRLPRPAAAPGCRHRGRDGCSSAAGFAWMSTWGLTSLSSPGRDRPAGAWPGSGFGLALAPVNAALLAATADAVHGITSALLVVARMVGMLVGISALTTIGLRRYYAVQVDLPAPTDVCASGTQCSAYTRAPQGGRARAQLQTVFVGAAVCAVVAAVLALLLLVSRAETVTRPQRRSASLPS